MSIDFIKTNFPLLKIVYRFFKSLQKTIKRGNKSSDSIENSILITLDNYKNVFCGYYDHSPFCPIDENLILLHATNATAFKSPNSKYKVDICLVNIQTGKIVKKLGTTDSWNWQQGARANWIGSTEYIYNIYDKQSDSYKSVVGDINSSKQKILPLSVQEYDNNGNIYSISYEALAKHRPDYGYKNKKILQEVLDNNAIIKYNIKAGEQNILLQISQIRNFTLYTDGKKPINDKFNHLLCSPSSKSIVFLYRYFINDLRYTDLYLLDLNKRTWKRLLANAGVSHYCWKDENNLLFTGNINSVFGYYEIDITTTEVNIVKEFEDGHPTISSENEFITDSYSDSKGFRHLYHVDKNKKFIKVASFIEPLLFQGETRCDLHPSLSTSKKYIQVDIALNSNKKAVAIIKNTMNEI